MVLAYRYEGKGMVGGMLGTHRCSLDHAGVVRVEKRTKIKLYAGNRRKREILKSLILS